MGAICSKHCNVAVTTGNFGGKNYSGGCITNFTNNIDVDVDRYYKNWIERVEKSPSKSIPDCLYKIHDVEYTKAITVAEIREADYNLVNNLRTCRAYVDWIDYIITFFIMFVFLMLAFFNIQVYKPTMKEYNCKKRYALRLNQILKEAKKELRNYVDLYNHENF